MSPQRLGGVRFRPRSVWRAVAHPHATVVLHMGVVYWGARNCGRSAGDDGAAAGAARATSAEAGESGALVSRLQDAVDARARSAVLGRHYVLHLFAHDLDFVRGGHHGAGADHETTPQIRRQRGGAVFDRSSFPGAGPHDGEL